MKAPRLTLLLLLSSITHYYSFLPSYTKRSFTKCFEKKDDKKKEELVKAVGEKMRKRAKKKEDSRLLDKINPFRAGQKLRKNIDQALSSLTAPQNSVYYLDDRITDRTSYSERTGPEIERLDQDDYIPEVLVVGATGEVGRLVVRRLLLDGRFRVRVLVRNLYTSTLEMFGTGVTYCQGDLNNIDSLEYALTDVDKIVFCASAPKPDEDRFQQKFEDFMKENLIDIDSINEQSATDTEWEQLDSVLQARAKLAEQVDCIGMQNLVRAYQDVRHADYGTSQSAKRTLFKFPDRPEDFNIFSLDEGEGSMGDEMDAYADYFDMDEAESEFEDVEDYYDDGYDPLDIESREDGSIQTQVQWIRNKFGHAVFVGRIPKGKGEASVTSIRLRSRDDPGNGLDLSNTFAGFIARVCSDGGTYEAFIRTRTYEKDGIEYVCDFSTRTKATGKNKSANKFVTVRLPFENFKAVRRGEKKNPGSDDSIQPFRGGDVRQIGFRFRSENNKLKDKLTKGDLNSFYLAVSYVKLYRAQPEPEFVYLSDANIPPLVRNGMVKHDTRRLLPSDVGDNGYTIFDESQMKTLAESKTTKSPEETYYKFVGEDILKKSGLSYAIVRVAGYSEAPGEASTIELQPSNAAVTLVSRDDAAQVCVSALLDPNALNKSFYLTKKESKARAEDEDISSKFSALPIDVIT